LHSHPGAVIEHRDLSPFAESSEIFYNRQRPHSTLGYHTPAAALAASQTAIAA